MEYTLILAALLTGSLWLRNPTSVRNAGLCGIVLGVACAFHNGLFLLQLPMLGAVLLLWIKSIHLTPRATVAMTVALFGTTLLVVIPSAPFREGMFTYDLLSWFHLYVAFCSCIFLLLLQRLPRNGHGIAILAVATVALLSPLVVEVRSGLEFVGMDIAELQGSPEAQSVFGGPGTFSELWWHAWKRYSGLVLVLPAVMAASAWLAIRDSKPASVYFYTFVVAGASLLLAQYRFHQFGSFALYLPLLLWWQNWFDQQPDLWRKALLTGVLIAAYVPVVSILTVAPVPGYSGEYVATRSVYAPLAEACARRPGVVLAEHNDGHYIRFHTECAVIANNLILSRQSREKIAQTRKLFSLTPKALMTEAPWVDYVLVSRSDNVLDRSISEQEVRRLNRGLRTELLLEGSPFPDGFRLLHQAFLQFPDGEKVILARAFELQH